MAAISSNPHGSAGGSIGSPVSPFTPKGRPSRHMILPTTVVVLPVPAFATSSVSSSDRIARTCSGVHRISATGALRRGIVPEVVEAMALVQPGVVAADLRLRVP